MFNDGEPRELCPATAWAAFATWAPCHWAEADELKTYYDMGYYLAGQHDLFQINPKNQSQLLYWAIQLKEKYVADTVVLQVPADKLRLLEFALGIQFHYRRGPVIMILRRR